MSNNNYEGQPFESEIAEMSETVEVKSGNNSQL